MMILDRLFKRKIIICVHGLSNKPPEKLLRKWWKQSIMEGFETTGVKKRSFNCIMVYWADLLHDAPQDTSVTDEKSDRFLKKPYRKGDTSKYRDFSPSVLKQKLLQMLERKLDKAFFDENSIINYDRISDLVVKNLYKDLDFYYNRDCPVVKYRGLNAMREIRGRLASVLRKHRHKKILLIAHSMGTIISHDVLTRTAPDITLHTLITIGSPLGLPLVIKKICRERGQDFWKDHIVPAPENITSRWLNFSDLSDRVAINYNLADDFKKNSRGIGPADSIVYNNYEIGGKRDAHNAYGYCRAPEVAQAIHDFIGSK